MKASEPIVHLVLNNQHIMLRNFYPKHFTINASHSHAQTAIGCMQGTNQLVSSNWGLGVLLRDTDTPRVVD